MFAFASRGRTDGCGTCATRLAALTEYETLEARREQKQAERWEKIRDKLIFWR